MSEKSENPTNGEASASSQVETQAGPVDQSPQDALQRERDDLYDRLLRKTAEFDNFRKRVERDRKDMRDSTTAEVLGDLLPIVDDFDRAFAAPAPPEAEPFKSGFELIHKQLHELLKRFGVTLLDPIGADFDPHEHQAVAYEEVDGAREGEVVTVMAKGYKLGERLLRPALVKVAKAS